MPKLRVLRIITRLNIGGPALHVAILTRRLDPSRFETLLVAGQEAPSEGSMLSLGRLGEDVRPMRVPELVRRISPLSDLRALWRVHGIVRAYRPQIVHTHLAKAGTVGRIAARLARVPIVLHTFHGSVIQGYFGAARSRSVLLIERAMARISTRVISISPTQTAELRAAGIGRDRLVEVPLGLELDPFRVAPRGRLRRELGVPPAAPLIGLVGRLVPVKRVDLFLEAAALVSRRHPDATFVVVGDGELRRELVEQAQRLGIGPRVHFLGWRSDLPGIYADLDVVALTSRNEGTPVSVIEALASARPVVATAVGGVPDLLGRSEFGSLVPPGDPDAIAIAIVDLLADEGRRTRLAELGPSRVIPAYDAGTLVTRIEQLYQDLGREHGID